MMARQGRREAWWVRGFEFRLRCSVGVLQSLRQTELWDCDGSQMKEKGLGVRVALGVVELTYTYLSQVILSINRY